MGPLLPDPGGRGPRLTRRVRCVAIELGAFTLITLTAPLLLVLATLVDLVLWLLTRKPWMAVRLVAIAWIFLLGELRGLVVLGLLWAVSLGRDTRRRRVGVYRLRQRWMGGHLDAIRRVFGLTFAVEGLEDAAPGPLVILMNHASIIDNSVPDALIGRAHDLGLRFVLKRELRMLATIDIGGGWVPTAFVARGSGDTARETALLRELGTDLGPDEGILIYPEGTRFTPKKLARAQEIIRERQPDVAPLADGLRHTLPPRLGGPLELLDAAAGADVVFFGTIGFAGFEYISDIWRGKLVGTTIRMRFWRHPAHTVPAGREERIRWLYGGWQTLDDWVGSA